MNTDAASYPNDALTAVCEMLIDDFELTQDQIASLAKDIAAECEAIRENRAEAAWEARQARLMETGGPDDGTYRQQMRDAGRGHLLRS